MSVSRKALIGNFRGIDGTLNEVSRRGCENPRSGTGNAVMSGAGALACAEAKAGADSLRNDKQKGQVTTKVKADPPASRKDDKVVCNGKVV